jgi:hypothetical protein
LASVRTVVLRLAFEILNRKNMSDVNAGVSVERPNATGRMNRGGGMLIATIDATVLTKKDAAMSRLWKKTVGVVL